MSWIEVNGGLPILVQQIINELFKPERRRLQAVIDALILENASLTGTRKPFLLWQGQVYIHSAEKQQIPPKSVVPSAHKDLVPRLLSFVSESKDINMDARMIYQILTKLLGSVTSNQQFRDALPDCLVQFVGGVSGLKRLIPLEDLIRHDERFLNQFRKILPTIEMYAAASLLY